MLSIDGFPRELRVMSKDELEHLVLSMNPLNRLKAVMAAYWLAKTGELGGAGSRLGETRLEAVHRVGQMLGDDELLEFAMYLAK